MNPKFLSFLVLLFAVACKKLDPQPFVPAQVFGDHMVLQQNDDVAIWGSGTPGDEIKAQGSWSDAFVSTQAGENGQWRLSLPTPEAGGPYLLDISQSDTLISFSDVMIGEVWLASGQSNMEMPLTGYLPTEPVDNYEQEIAEADYPAIRFINVARNIAATPIDSIKGNWMVTSSETAEDFSATAYFFARQLHRKLNVPIGIIHTSWGGTPVESWISKEKLLELKEFEEELAALDPEKIKVFQDWFDEFPSLAFPENEEEWEALHLQDSQYSGADFDDSQWASTDLPGEVENMEVTHPDGAYWFRRKINIDQPEDLTLSISEGIDDMDMLYVNGEKIAFTLCWNCPREYTIPATALNAGENQLAFRMIDTGGGGGFRGEMTLTNASGKQLDFLKNWKYKDIAGIVQGKFILFHANPEALARPPEGIESYVFNSWTPTGLFNAMISPVIPYNIKGAIWYQGESNVGRAEQYKKTFPGMIDDWRSRWENEFPFYFVQIAPFDYGSGLSPALRDAQRKSLKTPKTGMAVTMDIGLPTNIHPGNKQDVGKRLALHALARDYGKDIVPSGPLYKGHTISDGKMVIEFDHAESGLVFDPTPGMPFEIAGENGEFIQAQAEEKDGKMVVWSMNIPNPKHVRYAWRDFTTVTLFNKEGLPASSFTTE